MHVPKVTYFKCDKLEHKAYACLSSESENVKKVWVPKGTIVTNPKGSKKDWVPKVKVQYFDVGVSCILKIEKKMVS